MFDHQDPARDSGETLVLGIFAPLGDLESEPLIEALRRIGRVCIERDLRVTLGDSWLFRVAQQAAPDPGAAMLWMNVNLVDVEGVRRRFRG